MVFLTSSSTLAKSRASTAMAVASPPASLISLSTVLMVEWTELGFGGKCVEEEKASLVVLADKTTIVCLIYNMTVQFPQFSGHGFSPA